jgi:hypothetical protein
MRIVSLLSIGLAASAMAVAGCGGATSTPGGDGTGDARQPGQPGASTDSPATGSSSTGKQVVGASCAKPTPVIVASGGVIARPTGSVMRLQLVYQGTSIGVTDVRGVDMILPRADGPFVPGKVAGYWFETRDGSSTTYQHLFQDPTSLEAPGAPGGGGFAQVPVDRCSPKLILADLPSSPSATELIVYGSPYGTSDGAVELARFTLK